MNSSAFSQNTGSSILCLPINDARAAVKIIESLRIDSLRMSRNLTVLRSNIMERDNTILLLNERVNSFKALAANYDKQVANLNKRVDLSSGLNTVLGKKLKWANTKTWVGTGVGLLIAIVVAVKK